MTATRDNVTDGWVRCPRCGKKLLPVTKDTEIKKLFYKCKSSQCKGKEEFEIIITRALSL